jgi:hypothetical protein
MTSNTASLTELDRPEAAENADISFDTLLQGPPEAGWVRVGVQLTDMPVGCQVWFANTDGTITIAIQPITVQGQYWVVGIPVDLPANYSCTIRVSVALNGTKPGPGALIQLFVAVPFEGGVGQEPQPGDMLCSVTLQP